MIIAQGLYKLTIFIREAMRFAQDHDDQRADKQDEQLAARHADFELARAVRLGMRQHMTGAIIRTMMPTGARTKRAMPNLRSWPPASIGKDIAPPIELKKAMHERVRKDEQWNHTKTEANHKRPERQVCPIKTWK
jgi:hypothetical protein